MPTRVGVRRGSAALVAAAAAAALLIGLYADQPPRSVSPAAPGTLAFTECIPTGTIDSVSDLNRFVGTVRGNPEFAGGDVGASVRLQDGRSLFVFGDTLRGKDFPGQQFVHNSMLVFQPGCGRVVMPKDRGALIPDRADGVGYWPMSVARVEHPGYDLVGVSAQRVRATGSGDVFGFEILGPAGALFKVPAGGTPQLLETQDYGPDRADTTRPMWGAAVHVEGNWVYLYGTTRHNDATTGGFALRLARVRIADLLDFAAWRFWDGRRWGTDPGKAATLIPAQGGVSETLSVIRDGDRWYVISKRDEVLGTDLAIWTADAPTGPFTVTPPVAYIPSDGVSGTLRYMPLAHPDLLPEPGTVLVSYSQNNTDYAVVAGDPRKYRPRFLRVRLPD